MWRSVRRHLHLSLWEMTPRDHRETPRDLRRRQWVTALVVVVGAVLLGVSLRIEPGSAWFYPAALLLAGVWAGGAFASGPLHLGRIGRGPGGQLAPRPVLQPILIGLGLAAVFVLGGLVVREIPALDAPVREVLAHADQGSGPLVLLVTVVNGIAEELFFRGAAYAAITRHPVLVTTLAYGAATAVTGNAMLTLAALLLGLVVGLERRASGGILAPILTHLTWSVTMLYALPALFL